VTFLRPERAADVGETLPIARWSVGARRYSATRCAAVLVALAAIQLPLYAAIYFVLPQSPQYTSDPRALLVDRVPLWSAVVGLGLPHPTAPMEGLALIVGVAAATFGCYAAAVEVSRRAVVGRVPLWVVLGLVVPFGLLAVLALPNAGSEDVLWYVKEARVATIYHANPYAFPPAPRPGDPYLQFGLVDRWMQRPIPYGPAWTLLAVAWQWVVGDDVVRSLLGFRALLFGFNLAAAGLVWAILGRLARSHRLAGLVFFAWNPIVLVHGNDHLDVVMAFLLLLGVYLLLLDRWWLGLVALSLSALTKFLTAPLVLAHVVASWRRGSWRSAIFGALLAGAVALLLFAPFLDAGPNLLLLSREPHNANPGSMFSLERVVFVPPFLVLCAWVARRPQTTIGQLLESWAAIMLGFALFFFPPQYDWYLLAVIAVVAVAGSPRLALLALALSLSAWTNYMVGQAGKPYMAFPPVLFRLIWWGPPLAVLAWTHARRTTMWLRRPHAAPTELGSSALLPSMERSPASTRARSR
jgi:hypothetical protein